MWLGRVAVLLALFSLSGMDRALVQAYAWGTMIHDRAPEMGLDSAINDTFSGDHPCEVCLAVLEETHKQQQPAPGPEQQDQNPKLFATASLPPSIGLATPIGSQILPAGPPAAFDSVIHELPTPPPRRVSEFPLT